MSANTPRADVAQFLAFISSQPKTDWAGTPAAQLRQMPVAMRHLADAETGPLAKIEDMTIPGPAGDIPARLYDARESRDAGPVMVFYHGGGFCICNIETHEPWCAEAARQLDMPVISIDYRLAPEHPYPAAPQDCEAATRWIAENIPCSGLVLAGDSAGGNLTVVTAMALARKPAAKPVIAQYAIYPAVTTQRTDWESFTLFGEGHFLTADSMNWFSSSYGAASHAGPDASPLEHDFAGMPPAVVHTAGLDPLRDQGRAYAAKLIDTGIRCTYIEAAGNIHGFINMRKAIPSTAQDMQTGFDALNALLAEIA